MKPLIGIVAKPLSDFECPDDIWVEDYAKDEFRDAICANGGVAIGILPPFRHPKYNADESDAVFKDNLTDEEKAGLDAVLELCAGFILQGGLSADFYELYIARWALAHGKPILGVCAGFNTLARAAGANIVSGSALGIEEKRHNVYDCAFRHEISVLPGTPLHRLFSAERLSVNSLHTQFIPLDRVQTGEARITVNATAADTLSDGTVCETVEAFTVPGAHFALGVKWHPELMEEPHRTTLFAAFLEACRT